MALYEMRTFTCRAGLAGDWIALQDDLGRRAQAATWPHLAGCFVAESGELNQVIQLWRWESFEQRNALRLAVTQHPEFEAYSKASRELVVKMESRFMTAVAFSAMS